MILNICRADFTPRVTWSQERSLQWWSSVSRNVNDSWWKNNLRMSHSTFTFICRELSPYISKHSTAMREPMELERRVAVTIQDSWGVIWAWAFHCWEDCPGNLSGNCKTFASCVRALSQGQRTNTCDPWF